MLQKVDGETEARYGVFLRYVRMGAARSIPALKKALQDEDGITLVSSKELAAWRDNYKWDARAEEFDVEHNMATLELIKEEREKSKVLRVLTLVKFFEAEAEEVENVEWEEIRPVELTDVLRKLAQELRAEFNDTPTQRVETIKRVTSDELRKESPSKVLDLCMGMLRKVENAGN